MPNIKHIVSGMVANSVRIHNYSEVHSYSLDRGRWSRCKWREGFHT